MAVERQTSKISARMKLNNGTGPDGQIKTVNQTLPTLNYDTYSEATDDAKLMAVVEAIVPCLAKSVYSVEVAPIYTLVG